MTPSLSLPLPVSNDAELPVLFNSFFDPRSVLLFDNDVVAVFTLLVETLPPFLLLEEEED